MSLLLDALNKAQRQTTTINEPDENISDTVDLSEAPDLDIEAYTTAQPNPKNPAQTKQHAEIQPDELFVDSFVDSKDNSEDIHRSITYDDIVLSDDAFTPKDSTLSLDTLSLVSAALSSDSIDEKSIDQFDIDTEPVIPSPPLIHRSIHDGVLADLEADLQRAQSPVENIESPRITSTAAPSATTSASPSAPATPLTSTESTKPVINTSRASARRLFNASSRNAPKGRKYIYAFAAITTIGMLAGAAYVYSITQEFQAPVRPPPGPITPVAPPEQQSAPDTNPINESGTTNPVGIPQPELMVAPSPTQPPTIDHAVHTNNKPAPIPASGIPAGSPADHIEKTTERETIEDFPDESLPDFDTVAVSQQPPSSTPAPTREIEPVETTLPIIRVTRATAPAQVSDYIVQAYTAFQYGEWQTAYNQYQNALREEPNNRDAMLGLAAIAVHQKNAPLARSYYSKLLQFNSNDAIAIAGLQGVAPTSDTAGSESELKTLIAKTPDAPYLHFALGNVYVQQQRWPDAERAFFEAYRQDKNHPDYAYNLAISLDHLGQSSPALHYYETALSLAMTQTPGFDVEQAKQRISDLRRVIGVPSP